MAFKFSARIQPLLFGSTFRLRQSIFVAWRHVHMFGGNSIYARQHPSLWIIWFRLLRDRAQFWRKQRARNAAHYQPYQFSSLTLFTIRGFSSILIKRGSQHPRRYMLFDDTGFLLLPGATGGVARKHFIWRRHVQAHGTLQSFLRFALFIREMKRENVNSFEFGWRWRKRQGKLMRDMKEHMTLILPWIRNRKMNSRDN